MALEVGLTCLIVYEEHEEIAHQRVLLKRVTPAMFAYITGEAARGGQNLFWVMTPDGDVYPEEIAIPALKGYQLCREDGMPIPGTREGEIATRRRYGFGGRGRQPLTCESVLRACSVAMAEEQATTVHEPEGAPAAGERDWGVVAAGRLEGAAGAKDAEEVIAGNNLLNAEGENWLLLEAVGNKRQGEAVPAGVKVTRSGERGVAHFEEGSVFVVTEGSALMLDAGGGLGALLRRSKQRQDLAASREPLRHHDLRVLAISTDVHGDRFREWREVAASVQEQRMDEWPLEGPRTMSW
eukprot:6484807-Amphidinium_carterae.1